MPTSDSNPPHQEALPPEVAPPRYRFEWIEASVHWAHTEVAIDLDLSSVEDGRTHVRATVWYYGDYWDTEAVPQNATIDLVGRLVVAAGIVRIVVEQPAPLATLTFAADCHQVRWFNGPRLTRPELPDFCGPLLAWARDNGVSAPLL